VGERGSRNLVWRAGRAWLAPLLLSILLLGGLFLLVNQNIEIPFLYRVMPSSSR